MQRSNIPAADPVDCPPDPALDTIKAVIEEGLPDPAAALFRTLTGIDPREDTVIRWARGARDWALWRRARTQPYEAWMHKVRELLKERPDPPGGADGALLGTGLPRVAIAADMLLAEIKAVEQAELFHGHVKPRGRGRAPDTDGHAFTTTLVWLWRLAERPSLTDGKLALLGLALQLDPKGDHAVSHPIKRWGDLFARAKKRLDAPGGVRHTTETMYVIYLSRVAGGPEHVLEFLHKPETVLDEIERDGLSW